MATKKDWSRIIDEADELTKKEFANRISSLTSLTDKELVDLIDSSSISHDDLARILGVLHDATLSNDQKAKAISDIDGGLSVIISLAKKIF